MMLIIGQIVCTAIAILAWWVFVRAALIGAFFCNRLEKVALLAFSLAGTAVIVMAIYWFWFGGGA